MLHWLYGKAFANLSEVIPTPVCPDFGWVSSLIAVISLNLKLSQEYISTYVRPFFSTVPLNSIDFDGIFIKTR